jgi:3-phosphoshikimate 1-carboxyvinyltransferase
MIEPSGDFSSELEVSGDKSITHRALLLGAIGEGTTIIHNGSKGQDCLSTACCLKQLGVDIKTESSGSIVIHGKGAHGFDESEEVLDCGNSGTTMRLLAGLLSGQDLFSVLTGDASLRQRPMSRVIEPLRLMGAEIQARANGRFSPLAITGAALHGIDYELPVASAQVKSAVLLAGLRARAGTTVTDAFATRDHTERMLKYFGADLTVTEHKVRITPGNLKGQELAVPGDISSAAFFMSLALISKTSEIHLRNIGVNPTRTGIIEALRSMGAEIGISNERMVANEPVADISARSSPLKGTEINGRLIPRLIDELPVIAVVATQADGTTIVQNARELRVKETDRIKAIVGELKKMGAHIQELEDGYVVEGRTKLKAAVCESFNDHRIAMALTVAGLIAEGTTIVKNADCIGISFPEFVSLFQGVAGGSAVSVKD